MLKRGLIFLSIVAIVSILSGCKHTGLPAKPVYRECGYAIEGDKKIIYCEYMAGDNKPETYPATDGYLSQFVLIPLVDVPNLESYEAKLRTWIDQRCN